jgi:hypothetical protein
LGEPLEGRRLVAFGDTIGIEGAFGVDAACAVLFSGPVTGGHHQAAIRVRAGIPVVQWVIRRSAGTPPERAGDRPVG